MKTLNLKSILFTSSLSLLTLVGNASPNSKDINSSLVRSNFRLPKEILANTKSQKVKATFKVNEDYTYHIIEIDAQQEDVKSFIKKKLGEQNFHNLEIGKNYSITINYNIY